MAYLFDDNKIFVPAPSLGYQSSTDKGEQLMESLLLNQYQNSPNLKEYMMSFISEMDFLFQQVEEVYLGRFLEDAVGSQLDVIGIILQQTRAVILPVIWFGFAGAVNVAGMVDEAGGGVAGGLFQDEAVGDAQVTPLDDMTYRRVLLAKALITNRDSVDISMAYYFISTLIGKVPATFKLRDFDSGEGIEKRRVDLVLEDGVLSLAERQLILYMSKYFVPSGIKFTITQV